MKPVTALFAGVALALAIAMPVLAQPVQTVRVVGTIEAVDGQITGTVQGDKSELKPGVAIVIVRAMKRPDGTLEANRVNAGRDGMVPQ
jgi:hypothetical protein